MTGQPLVRSGRSYLTISAAVITAAVVVCAAILTSSALYGTVTETTTITTTTTVFTQRDSTTGISTSVSPYNVTASSIAYSPSQPVEISGVTAVASAGPNDTTTVVFHVLFGNVGQSSIYYVGGCGSGLSTSIPEGSTVLKQGANRVRCLCAEFVVPLKSGQNGTSVDPGCWSQYYYELVGHGTVELSMALAWSTGSQDLAATNATSIQARFTF